MNLTCFTNPLYKLFNTSFSNKNVPQQPGHNEGLFVVESVHVEVPFSIFLLEQNAKLVLTDIDGTITESNIKGLVFPQFGIDAHQVSCINLKSWN